MNVLIAALVMALGWSIRGRYGHCTGAMMPGALLAMFVAISSARPDWWRRTAILGLAGAIGWAFGGQSSYGLLVGYTATDSFADILYGYGAFVLVGAVWGGIGGGLLGIGLTWPRSQLNGLIGPLLAIGAVWTAAEWTGVRAKMPSIHDTYWFEATSALAVGMLYGLLRGESREACKLIVYLTVGWWLGLIVLTLVLGWQLNPPRSDSWAACSGVAVAVLVYLWQTENRAAMLLARYGFLAGGIGFLLGDFVQIVQRSKWGVFQHAVLQEHSGWGKMEKLFGFIMGCGVALGAERLAREGLEPPVEDDHRGLLNEFAVFVLFVPMLAWNFGQNVGRWQKEGVLPEHVLGISSPFWTKAIGVLWVLLVLFALVQRRRRGLALLPATPLGKGQLLFLVLLGVIFCGSFAGFLPTLKSTSVATSEIFYILCASAATVAILVQGSGRAPTTRPGRARSDRFWASGWGYWLCWPLVAALAVGLAWFSASIAPPTKDPKFYRFPPAGQAATKPAAKSVALAQNSRKPIPDRLVVLTFDDSVKSHFTVAAPILKKYGFSATFFITEGFTFKTNKRDYMTWDEIKQLDRLGFEIGNHTRDHLGIKTENVAQLEEQLQGVDASCASAGIVRPTSFAWPGNQFAIEALPTLRGHGILFARRGGQPEFAYDEGRGVAYEPGVDDPLLIPTTGDARPNWTLDDLVRAVRQAHDGRIAVLQFHGVPEGEHPWVHTPQSQFEQYMAYLHQHGYRVIALRDLARFVDPQMIPADPRAAIQRRISAAVNNSHWARHLPLRGAWALGSRGHLRSSLARSRAPVLARGKLNSALEFEDVRRAVLSPRHLRRI